ncbi:MAG: MFS transporter [Pseudomonadota bacterium]|nr:MFS transporter [Pseudomonadota bacterium]
MVNYPNSLRQEIQAVTSLSAIFAFRMLGLFLILPIFAVAALHYSHANPQLIGLGLGAYGLTQALLQIPFGLLSDRFGRKRIILLGLCLFALGSLCAASATSIYGLIFGRFLQGAGAIGSTIMATLADLTKVENRTKAMAVIGLTVGISFSIAMILGPILYQAIGLSGIFILTAGLALIGVAITLWAVPTPPQLLRQIDSKNLWQVIAVILHNKELMRLNLGIFTSHALLTACFTVLPTLLLQHQGFTLGAQWQFYLPILGGAFFAMVPFIIIAEKYHQTKLMLLLAITTLFLSLCALSLWHASLWQFAASLFAFFTAFSFLEATLPSLVSKIAPAAHKGTTMGVFSSCQFLGIFCGGSAAGVVQTVWGMDSVFIFCAILSAIWLLLAFNMAKPAALQTRLIPLSTLDSAQAHELTRRLNMITGVVEAAILLDDGIAYLKVNNTILDKSALQSVTQTFVRD